MDLSELNENQLTAVKWDNGPLLLLAGPGSGKTRVLTYRIAKVLESSENQHFRILALTFTNKAATEMRNRVEELVPQAMERVQLTTFHSFCASLLRQHGSHINLKPDFTIISQDVDRELFLDTVLDNLRSQGNIFLPTHFQAGRLLPVITGLIDNCVTVDEADLFLNENSFENAEAVATIYKEYRNNLKQANTLDFPSLIADTIDLLERYPAVIKFLRKVYKHICVDEFQDTNFSQYKILNLITKPDPSTLFVVADDDQIIYQWNGAEPQRLEDLRSDFDVTDLQLPENYRCPPQVIRLANQLIENNSHRSTGKKPQSAVKVGDQTETLRVFHFSTVEEEVRWVAEEISKLSETERENCAILARTGKLITLVAQAIETVELTPYLATRKDEFRSAPLRFLHSFLRLVNNQNDNESLNKLCKAFFDLEGVKISYSEVISRASAEGLDYVRAWLREALVRDASLDETTRIFLTEGMVPILNQLNYKKFSKNCLAWAVEKRGQVPNSEISFDEFDEEQTTWNELTVEIEKRLTGESVGLHTFLQELDLNSKSPAKKPGAIPCYTIHASKGLEFGHVYLIGLVEDQLPNYFAIKKGNDSAAMQEERRNCFVAITRAQERLTLTFSQKMFGYPKKPSRFLREMGIDI